MKMQITFQMKMIQIFHDNSRIQQQPNATIIFGPVGVDDTVKLLGLMPYGSTAYVYGWLSGSPTVNMNVTEMMTQKKSESGFMLGEWFAKNPKIFQDLEFHKKPNGLLKNELKTTFILIYKEARQPLFQPSEKVFIIRLLERQLKRQQAVEQLKGEKMAILAIEQTVTRAASQGGAVALKVLGSFGVEISSVLLNQQQVLYLSNQDSNIRGLRMQQAF